MSCDCNHETPCWISHDGSMGVVYLPTWMVDFYAFHVGKSTSPMDPSWVYYESLWLDWRSEEFAHQFGRLWDQFLSGDASFVSNTGSNAQPTVEELITHTNGGVGEMKQKCHQTYNICISTPRWPQGDNKQHYLHISFQNHGNSWEKLKEMNKNNSLFEVYWCPPSLWSGSL